MERKKPDREYLILFLARTGSSHLAELLTSAGVGDVREWLNPAFREAQAKYFGSTDLADYFAAIRSACPDGTFGQKMTIWFYEAFSREANLDDHFDFEAPKVFLFRENIVEQAVSMCFAARRNVFHRTGTDAAPLAQVEYDAHAIRECIEGFADEERRLQQFVEAHGGMTRYVSYEQITESDPATVVSAIADLVGVAPNHARLKSTHHKLGDEQNRAHATRFIEEELDYVEALAAERQWLFEAAERAPLI